MRPIAITIELKDQLVIDENNVILGGNMRFKACKELNYTDVPVHVLKGLTEKQKKEFVIKDNSSFGDWDWSILINDWNSKDLDSWGIDVWNEQNEDITMVNEGDENSEWVDMPEFSPKGEVFKIIVSFLNEQDRLDFLDKYKIEITHKDKVTWSTHYPYTGTKDLKSLEYE